MTQIHTFQRPEVPSDLPPVGTVYSATHNRYDEGARYTYHHGGHDLVLFWRGPSTREISGLRDQPVELGLYLDEPAAFLLYKIAGVCEWSDVAFNVHLIPEAGRELPNEAPGERARFIVTLVDADDGVVKARRFVSLDRVMTQALRHAMQAQAAAPFNRLLYEAAVQATHTRFADSDAMAAAAEVVEATLG